MSNAAVVCMPTLTSHYNVVLHHFVSTVLCDDRLKLPTLSLLQSVLIHAVHLSRKVTIYRCRYACRATHTCTDEWPLHALVRSPLYVYTHTYQFKVLIAGTFTALSSILIA